MNTNLLILAALIGGIVLSNKKSPTTKKQNFPNNENQENEEKNEDSGIKDGYNLIPINGYTYDCTSFAITDTILFNKYVSSTLGSISKDLQIKDKKTLANVNVPMFVHSVVSLLNPKCLKPITEVSNEEKISIFTASKFYMTAITQVLGKMSIPVMQRTEILKNFDKKYAEHFSIPIEDLENANFIVNENMKL